MLNSIKTNAARWMTAGLIILCFVGLPSAGRALDTAATADVPAQAIAAGGGSNTNSGTG